MMRIVTDLRKVEIPPLIRDGCSATHGRLTLTFERYHIDLSETDAAASNFSKHIKMIIESMDTNLKLLKSLKNSEAKKYEKEVQSLQTKFSKVMDAGKRYTAVENETEHLEREVEMLRSHRTAYSKNKPADIKAVRDRIDLLRQSKDKFMKEFVRVKQELEDENADINASRQYIVKTFNAHSESIDSRLVDNIEFYKAKLSDFARGLKLGTPQNTAEVSISSPFPEAGKSLVMKSSTSNAGSLTSEDDKPKRLVGQSHPVYHRDSVRRRIRTQPGGAPLFRSAGHPASVESRLTRCEVRNEILKYSAIFDRRDLETLASIFNKTISNSCGIDKLLLAFKEDLYRSVTNRLVYLLILSDERYGMLASKQEACLIVARLVSSLLSRA